MANATESATIPTPEQTRPQRVSIWGRDTNGVLRPVAVGTDGELVLNLTGEGLALDVSVDGIEALLTTLNAKWTATAHSDASRLPVDERDGLAVSGSVTSAATLFTQDMTGYESLSFQFTSAGSGNTVTIESSEDNTNWVSVPGINSATGLPGNFALFFVSGGPSTAAIYRVPKYGRYIRVRVSAYGSGTVTLAGSLHKAPINLHATTAAQGYAAEGSTASGNPLPQGLEARTTSKTSVTSGQMVRPISTVDGRQVVERHAIPENTLAYAAATAGILNTTTAVTMFAAAGASIRNYCDSLDLMAEALGAATEVAIRDGAGGAVLWRTKIGNGGLVSGRTIRFDPPLRGTANTLMEIVTLTASVTGAVYANAQGHVAP